LDILEVGCYTGWGVLGVGYLRGGVLSQGWNLCCGMAMARQILPSRQDMMRCPRTPSPPLGPPWGPRHYCRVLGGRCFL